MARDSLNRAQIVRAAIELLDADGVDGLSMRRLGTRLGSGATSVYWHVKSKDDLVVLAADEVFSEIALPDPGEIGWRAAASAMADDSYALLQRHHWVAPAMTTYLVFGPSLARYSDHSMAVFEAAGCTGDDVDWAVSVVLTFILGTALGEAAETAWRTRLRRGGGDEAELVNEAYARAGVTAEQCPRLYDRRQILEQADPSTLRRQAFDFGLQTILDGLAARLTGASTPADRLSD